MGRERSVRTAGATCSETYIALSLHYVNLVQLLVVILHVLFEVSTIDVPIILAISYAIQ